MSAVTIIQTDRNAEINENSVVATSTVDLFPYGYKLNGMLAAALEQMLAEGITPSVREKYDFFILFEDGRLYRVFDERTSYNWYGQAIEEGRHPRETLGDKFWRVDTLDHMIHVFSGIAHEFNRHETFGVVYCCMVNDLM